MLRCCMFRCSDEPEVEHSVRRESTAGTGTRLMHMTIGYFLDFMLHHLGVAKRLAAAYVQEVGEGILDPGHYVTTPKPGSGKHL